MRRTGASGGFLPSLALALALAAGTGGPAAGAPTVLRYAHPNSEESVAALQAEYFAAKVKEYSGGAVTVEVFPASSLGTLASQTEDVRTGAIALNHQTAAGYSALFPDLEVLDTPYLYDDVAHLLRVTAPDSPVMTRLAAGFLAASGLRVLYTFYFGARELTLDRPALSPKDLRGLKVRCIPAPMYESAVRGLGALPVPLDWTLTPTALATRAVAGQENPVNTILTSKLYQVQSCLMLTGHILGAELVVVNEEIWKGLSARDRAAILKAAAETSAWATKATLDAEARDLARLKALGMRVYGPAQGLDLAAFRRETRAVLARDLGGRHADYYRLIDSLR